LVNTVIALAEEGWFLISGVATFLFFAAGIVKLFYCCKNNAVIVLSKIYGKRNLVVDLDSMSLRAGRRDLTRRVSTA